MNGAERLAAYLRAPASVRESFDRRQEAAIERDLAECRGIDEWHEAEFGDDPLVQAVARRRRNDRRIVEAIDGTAASEPPTTVPGINWDARWQHRAEAARRRPGQPAAAYNREADPLFDLDLREVWSELTGFELRGSASCCPSPTHDDRFASCAVHARLFHCHACKAGGSIIDLGALVYDLEPRGASFFRIREQLFAALGIVEESA